MQAEMTVFQALPVPSVLQPVLKPSTGKGASGLGFRVVGLEFKIETGTGSFRIYRYS